MKKDKLKIKLFNAGDTWLGFTEYNLQFVPDIENIDKAIEKARKFGPVEIKKKTECHIEIEAVRDAYFMLLRALKKE